MRKLNLTGQRFGRLLVLEQAESKLRSNGKPQVMWFCACDCGNTTTVKAYLLTNGDTSSCGCLQKDAVRKTMTTHGMTKTKEYRTWASVKARCTNPKNAFWLDYGGRGIKMCDRWSNSFENFYADMGPVPSLEHTIERRDNEKGYSPDNCVWATQQEQQQNKRTSIAVDFQGASYPTLAALAAATGANRKLLYHYYRVRKLPINESVNKAITGGKK